MQNSAQSHFYCDTFGDLPINFILGGIHYMQVKGNEGWRGKRATAGSQMAYLVKELITNNRAQRGEMLSLAFDICHTSFLLLINIKHILKDGAHSSKNLPSRLWACAKVIYELCLKDKNAPDSWPLLLILFSCPHCSSGAQRHHRKISSLIFTFNAP